MSIINWFRGHSEDAEDKEGAEDRKYKFPLPLETKIFNLLEEHSSLNAHLTDNKVLAKYIIGCIWVYDRAQIERELAERQKALKFSDVILPGD